MIKKEKFLQIYDSTISFAYFEMFFLKIPMEKNFVGGVTSPPAPMVRLLP